MTEEEFNALLKVRDDKSKLVVNQKIVYEAFLVDAEFGSVSMSRWASSEDKELALETLAEKYFKAADANS